MGTYLHHSPRPQSAHVVKVTFGVLRMPTLRPKSGKRNHVRENQTILQISICLFLDCRAVCNRTFQSNARTLCENGWMLHGLMCRCSGSFKQGKQIHPWFIHVLYPNRSETIDAYEIQGMGYTFSRTTLRWRQLLSPSVHLSDCLSICELLPNCFEM